MRWIPLSCIAVLLAAFFGPALWRGEVLALRDTAHYYYPLFHFVLSEWKQGRIPLWNPYDGLGSPLAADPTSCAFYPGLLLVALPGDVGQGINLFILAHYCLAAWGSYQLARHWGASVAGATLASISYTFGGIVLFQYSNLVYLAGACWLPVTMLAWHRAIVEPRPAHTAFAGLSLAVLISSGDFQTAYHVVLLWLCYGLLFKVKDPPTRLSVQPSPAWPTGEIDLLASHRPDFVPDNLTFPMREHGFRILPVWLKAVVIALGLSAVIWLPAAEFGLLSDRQITDQPRSVYEWLWQWINLPATRRNSVDNLPGVRALLGHPLAGTHHAAAFQFSVAPTRWGEFLWPNFSGRLFPENRRWLSAVGGEDRIWTPSLYLGFLPFVLALSAIRLRSKNRPVECWLSWVGIVGLLASLGAYAPGMVIQYFAAQQGVNSDEAPLVGPVFGGLYWLATVILPGYITFRYPAKCLTLTAFALSQLAAKALEVRSRASSPRLAGLTMLMVVASLASYVGLFVWEESILDWLRRGQADPVFGPLLTSGAVEDLRMAFLQAAGVGLAALVMVWLFPPAGKWMILLVTAADLFIAHQWMIQSVPSAEWKTHSAVVNVFASRAWQSTTPAPPGSAECPFPRVFRAYEEVAPGWQHFSSVRRLTEVVAWHRDSLFSKFHLLVPVASLAPGNSCRLADWQFVLWVSEKPPRASGDVQPANLAEREGTDSASQPTPGNADGAVDAQSEPPPKPRFTPPQAAWALVKEGQLVDKMIPVVGEEAQAVPSGLALWQSLRPPQFAWFPRQVILLPQLPDHDPYGLWQRTAEVLFPQSAPRDLTQVTVVETDRKSAQLLAGLRQMKQSPPASPNSRPGPVEISGAGPKGNSPSESGKDLGLVGKWLSFFWEQGLGSSDAASSSRRLTQDDHENSPQCELIRFAPGEIWLGVTTPQDALLVIAQQYYPGWRAAVEPIGRVAHTQSRPIVRANRVMQGVVVPAGNWIVRLSFVPATFWAGVGISLTTLLLLTIWLAIEARLLAKSDHQVAIDSPLDSLTGRASESGRLHDDLFETSSPDNYWS